MEHIVEPKVTGYSVRQQNQIRTEFSRLKESVYLDHAGATLYSRKQMEDIFHAFSQDIYGNPHSRSTSGQLTSDAIDVVRYLILNHFNTNQEEYSIIFTFGATHALKLVAETFSFDKGSLIYLEDNHTSVLGMRAYAPQFKELKIEEAFKLFKTQPILDPVAKKEQNCLFVYPAQSNFAGTKYPMSWIAKAQKGYLDPNRKVFVVLDAACYVSTNTLDLSIYKPDFVTISFYKMFGYPTGLGALLVRKTSEHMLSKKYFGGGTVLMALSSNNVMVPRPALHERFEDGTLPYMSILAVKYGLDTFKRLNLTTDQTSNHTFFLARYTYNKLSSLHHSNNVPVAVLYHDNCFENIDTQGGIINFNLKRSDGTYVGYAEVLHLCNLHGIQLRTGCFCNPGACQRHLKLSSDVVWKQFESGHVCGDEHDLIDGYPTGSVRISFGYMSTYEDADVFLSTIEQCFVSKPVIKKRREIRNVYGFPDIPKTRQPTDVRLTSQNAANRSLIETSKITHGHLCKIYLYPIKSCGAYVPSYEWELTATGLKYDRCWMIVNSSGTCVSQKQIKELCMVLPVLDIKRNKLRISFKGEDEIDVPLEFHKENKKNAYFCESKVCGDKIQGWDCGDRVADWLCTKLGKSGLRLLRQCDYPDGIFGRSSEKGQSQLSLANKAQYLLVNLASVQWLKDRIPQDDSAEHSLESIVLRFRSNFVVDLGEPFVENNLNEVQIGEVMFQFSGQCARCQMICINQQSGEASKEPLQTLSRELGKIRFGIYLTQEIGAEGRFIKVDSTVQGSKND